MAQLINGAESGTTDGTTVTAANSGGLADNGFDSGNPVFFGASTTSFTFDNTQVAHGAHAYKWVSAAAAGTSQVGWKRAADGGSITPAAHWYGRIYLWGSQNPNANWGIMRWLSGGDSGTVCCTIQVSTTGKIRVLNTAGTVLATFTNSVPLSAPWRIEYDLTFSTTVGQYIVSLYAGDSTTAIETQTGSSNHNLGAATADTVLYVNPAGANIGVRTYYFDDININTVGMPGPPRQDAPPSTHRHLPYLPSRSRQRPVTPVRGQAIPVVRPSTHVTRRGVFARRGKYTSVPTSIPSSPAPDCSFLLINGDYIGTVDGNYISQAVCVPVIPAMLRYRRVTPVRLRRGRIEVIPPQVTVTNPSITFSPSQHRVLRGWLFRRGRTYFPTPTQTPAPNPPIVFSPSQFRIARNFFRRSKPINPVPTQVTVPNPAIVFRSSLRRTLRGIFQRRGKVNKHPINQSVTGTSPLIVVITADVSGGVEMTLSTSGKVDMELEVAAETTMTLSSLNYEP